MPRSRHGDLIRARNTGARADDDDGNGFEVSHETQLFRLEDGLAEGLRSFIGEDYQEVDLIASKAKLNVSRHASWEEFFAGPTGESIRLKIASSWDPDLLETFYPEFL